MNNLQHTIANSLSLSGYGVHSSKEAKLSLHKAPPDSGIVFICGSVEIKACVENIHKTNFCTSLAKDGVYIHTIEHLLSAINGLGLANLFIELEGNEIPILDGSALPFVSALTKAGIVAQEAERSYYIIDRPVRVEMGHKFAEFLPATELCFDVAIKFDSPSIGSQHLVFKPDEEDYASLIAPARTFGFLKDEEDLKKAGLAQGSSLENTVVIGYENEIMNENGLRLKDEFVRHKLLDAMGDIFLLGKPFLGKFRSYCSGHALNIKLVEKFIKNL